MAESFTPAEWKDAASSSPPIWYEMLAADGRWWFSSSGAMSTACTPVDAVPFVLTSDITVQYEVTQLMTEPWTTLPFQFRINAFDNFQEIPAVIGSGEFVIPAGSEVSSFGVIAFNYNFSYGGIVALRFIDPDPPPEPEMAETGFNCECVDTNDNLTMAQYRTRLLQRLGFSAVSANPPPGMADMLTTFLQDAQDFLYLKYPALRTRRIFRWSMEQGVRFYGMRENDENWTDAEVTLTVGAPTVVTFLGDAPADGRQVFFTVAAGGTLPTGIEAYRRYYVVNSSGSTCNLSLTSGGAAFNTTGATTGQVTATYSPADTCIFNFEPYKNIEGAWLVDLNGAWLPMVAGIPPVFYTTVTQPGLPVRYEIRQCIEVFPAPQADGYQLYIKGHFGKAAFSADTDKPTIDGQLVYLWALANALDYYGKPSAAGIAAQAREYLGSLVAGTHTSKRYVPGTREVPPAVMPLLLPGDFS